jgi:predicted nuclease with TOPRIM domain
MAIKEILDRIKASLGADASAETLALLSDASREAKDIIDSLNSANKECAARKYRNKELESELENAKAEIGKASSPELKNELNRLKEIETKYTGLLNAETEKLKSTWQEKAKTLTVDKTSKLYEKVQKVLPQFNLAQEGQELTVEQIKDNLKTYTLLEATGFFAAETITTGGNPPFAGISEPPQDGGARILALSKKPIK